MELMRQRDTHKSDELLSFCAETVLYPDEESCSELCSGCLRVSRKQGTRRAELRREREEVTIYPILLISSLTVITIDPASGKNVVKNYAVDDPVSKKAHIMELMFKRRTRSSQMKESIARWVNEACTKNDVELEHIDRKLDYLMRGLNGTKLR
jgi:hypothetical protein